MSIIFDQYEERLHRLKRNPSTLKGFKLAARNFEDYLRDHRMPAEKVDGLFMEEYIHQLDRAPTTKRLHLAHLGGAYRYALRRGLVRLDPTVDVMMERLPDKEPRTVPMYDLHLQKDRLSTDREWMLWHLLTYTGMRRFEILKLMWDDVRLGDNTIHVVGKGGKLRYVPIHPALGEAFGERTPEPGVPVIKGQRRHGEIRPTSVKTFHSVLKCINHGEYTAHDYRRTVASSLYRNGVDGDTIDKIMGWAPRNIRGIHYQHIAPEQLQRAILKLYADDPL